MPLATWVAGRYSATWAASDLGVTRRGWELDVEFKEEAINETDLFGQAMVDAVMRGADVSLSAELTEWTTTTRAAMWHIGGGTWGRIATTAAPIGILKSSIAVALVLSSTANTPAAAAPATLTAAGAVYAANANPRVVLDSRLRTIPMRWQFLPSYSGGTLSAFSTT